jgi:adenylate kinase
LSGHPIGIGRHCRHYSIIRDTRANKEEYIKRRNEARKICRDKKREMINNGIKELEI